MGDRRDLGRARESRLEKLVTDGVLTEDQAIAVRQALLPDPDDRATGENWMVEAAGYAGGCLLLAGIALFIVTSWETLTRGERSGLLAALAAVFLTAGIAVAGGVRGLRELRVHGLPMRRRIVAVLFVVSAVAAGMAAGVPLDDYAGVVGSLVGLAGAIAGLVAVPTPIGVLASAVTSAVVVGTVSEELLDLTSVSHGLLTIAVGLVWIGIAVLDRLSPRWLVFTSGMCFCLVGAQSTMGDAGMESLAYGLTLAVAIGCFILYRKYRLVVLLIGGVLATTIAVPEAVSDWTDGAVGGSVILLVAGAALVAASVVGLRLSRGKGTPGDRQGIP